MKKIGLIKMFSLFAAVSLLLTAQAFSHDVWESVGNDIQNTNAGDVATLSDIQVSIYATLGSDAIDPYGLGLPYAKIGYYRTDTQAKMMMIDTDFYFRTRKISGTENFVMKLYPDGLGGGKATFGKPLSHPLSTLTPNAYLHVNTGNVGNARGMTIDSDGEIDDFPFRLRTQENFTCRYKNEFEEWVYVYSEFDDTHTRFLVDGKGRTGISALKNQKTGNCDILQKLVMQDLEAQLHIWSGITGSTKDAVIIDSDGEADDTALRIRTKTDGDSSYDSNTDTKLVVKGDGKIGINTNTPEAQLHVEGDIRLSGSIATSSSEDDLEIEGNINIPSGVMSAGCNFCIGNCD